MHMIKLTRERQIAPYLWGHPDEDQIKPPCAA